MSASRNFVLASLAAVLALTGTSFAQPPGDLAGQQRQYIDMVLRACRGDTGLAAKVLGTDVQPKE